MEEKRKFPRINTIGMMVNWRKVETFDNLHNTKDISGGGICLLIERKESVDIGDTLQLEFNLPSGETIHSKGRAVWLDKFAIGDINNNMHYEVGIEFLDISDKDREAIKRYVFSHLPLKK